MISGPEKWSSTLPLPWVSQNTCTISLHIWSIIWWIHRSINGFLIPELSKGTVCKIQPNRIQRAKSNPRGTSRICCWLHTCKITTSEGWDAGIYLSKRRIVKYCKQAKARFIHFCIASHSILSIVPSWVAINNVKKVGHWNPPLFYIKITLRSNTTKQGRLAPPRVHMLIS